MNFKALRQIPVSIQSPIRWMIRPMLFLSLMLHGVILFFPMPAAEEETEQAEEVSVQITNLPESSEPLPEPAAEPPAEPLPEKPQPTPQGTPPAATAPTPQPAPTPQAAAAPDEPPQARPDSNPPADFDPEPDPEPSSPDLPPPTTTSLPFSGFPHLASASVGCFGIDNCHRVDGGNFRQVGNNLIEQLRAQGYTVKELDGESEAGLNVYEVTNDSVTQYLSLLQSDLGEAVYVLAAQPVTLSELNQAEPLKQKFEQVLRQVANGQQARYENFSYPDFFYNGQNLRTEIGQALYTLMDASMDASSGELTRSMMNRLTAAGFAAESIGSYAGAPLYRIHQGPFMTYLSILPTDDNAGNILVSWDRLPSSP